VVGSAGQRRSVGARDRLITWFLVLLVVAACGSVTERREVTLGRGTAAGVDWLAVAYPGTVGSGGPCLELRAEGRSPQWVCDVDPARGSVAIFDIHQTRVVFAVTSGIDAQGAIVTSVDGARYSSTVVADEVFGPARFVVIAVEGEPDALTWTDAQENELTTQQSLR
jgi:hypothetical protein